MKQMSGFIKILLFFAVFMSGFTPLLASPELMHVIYEKTLSAEDKLIEKELKKEGVTELVAEITGELFNFSKPLTLVYGGKEGPLFDSEINRILIPYDFVAELKERFRHAKYSDSKFSLNEAVMDAVMHTILHEMGHALIDMYDLPIVTKEEDAADSLATMLLIDFFEDGQEIALTAADLFDLESEDIDVLEVEDFWDEHSLDVQRYYSTLCYIYGSDPKEYAFLKKEAEFSEDRAERCVDEYDQLSFSWMTLLKPHLKKDAIK